ncbi:MAG: nuclear transport factor 2 family protein, partial [Acidimicrobiales bacterium]
MPLTAIDRLEIFELPARYADALDLRESEGLRWVFTDDAVWEIVDGRRLLGIDEIMEFMGRPDVHPGAHLMTNIYVSSVDEDALGGEVVVATAVIVATRDNGLASSGEPTSTVAASTAPTVAITT